MRQRWLNIHTFQLTSLLKWHCTISLYCLLLGTQSFKTMHVHYHLSVLKPFRSLWSGVITTLTIKKRCYQSPLLVCLSLNLIWLDNRTISTVLFVTIWCCIISRCPCWWLFFTSSRGSVEKTTNDGGWMVGGRMERQKQDMCLVGSWKRRYTVMECNLSLYLQLHILRKKVCV